MLLNRLFPQHNKQNRHWESKYSQPPISLQDQLAWIPDDDDNTHSRMHENRLLESQDEYGDYYFTNNLSERRRDVLLPELEIGGAYSPSTTYPINTPCINMKPYHKIHVSITDNFFPESDSARYDFPLFPHDDTQSKGHYRAHTNNMLEFGNAGFQDYKEHHDWELKYSQAEISAPDQLPWIPNDDDNTRHSRGHYGMLKNYLMEYEDAAYGDYYFTQNLCECPRGVKVFPELEVDGGEPHSLLLGWDYSNEKDEDSIKYLCGPSEDFSMNNQSEMRNAVVSTQDHFRNPNKVICENNFHDQEPMFIRSPCFFSASLDRELGEKHLLISDYCTENQLSNSVVHAYQNPQHVGPSACFSEDDKECFLYDPRWTSDCTNSLNCQDLSALNI